MRAYIAIKYHEDNRNRGVIVGIASILESVEIDTVCMARDFERWGEIAYSPEALMRLTFGEIEASDVLVIDLTEKGVGLGIEAGYAYARGIPIIVVAREGSQISETLLGICNSVLMYRDLDDLRRLPHAIARCIPGTA